MLTQSPTNETTDCPYLKTPGYEPIPGYRIIQPLGRGGFGEVWLCEAPGGLHKAVKFVPGDFNGKEQCSLKQEYEAFQTIKSIRHPFLLTLERVELMNHELVMVMELADNHLQDLQHEYQAKGQSGIPRAELIGYLFDAAEALDHISLRYGLQHLDVKPANLFLLSGHVKVGDYGLVARMTAGEGSNPLLNRGLTPKYVSPEVLRGQIHGTSDEYSLALVYFELLTGSFPFPARTAQQMMLAHVSAAPNLSALPPADQSVVAKALSKNPEDRFPSCLAFMKGLLRANESSINDTQQPQITRFIAPHQGLREQPTDRMMLPQDEVELTTTSGTQEQTLVNRPSDGLPVLRTVKREQSQPKTSTPVPSPPPPARRTVQPRPVRPAQVTVLAEPEEVILETIGTKTGVQLASIRSVVTMAALNGQDANSPSIWADQIVDSVIAQAAGGGQHAKIPGEIGRKTDGTWVHRFPSSLSVSLVSLKCEPMMESGWFDEVKQVSKTVFALRQYVSAGGLWGRLSNKRVGGLEILVHWPLSRGCGEVETQGRLFGTPDAEFVQDSLDVIPKLMLEIQALLQNVEDRRKSLRIPTQMPVKLIPVADDGTIKPMVTGNLRDISTGGLSCVVNAQPTSRYCYVNFSGCGLADEMAVLLRLLRVNSNGFEFVVSGKFRTDL